MPVDAHGHLRPPSDVPAVRAPLVAEVAHRERVVPIPRWMVILGAILAQAVLAQSMASVPQLGFVQLLGVVALALYGIAKRNALLVMCLIAYLPAAEITWRQARAPVPYLGVPYLLTALSVLLLVTSYRHLARPGRLALFYVLLLVPSSIVTISVAGENSREAIAFALSGPFALAALVMICSQIGIEPWFQRRLLWVMAISGTGPLVIALTRINEYVAATGSLTFGTESNFLTAGGFGPVQVSSVMGMTVLVSVLLYLMETEPVPKLLAVSIGLLAGVQSFLTFSRGGMFATAFALAALALSQAADRQNRRRVLVAVGAVFAVGYFVVVPRIDAFTEGRFQERFTDTRSARTSLASSDLELFRENPVFGVGPGMSRYRRLSYEVCQLRDDRCRNEGSSHTEFTRMPAEHGISGVLSIGILAAMAWQAWARAGSSRYLTASLLVWSIAQMFYANMRVGAIPLAFAFAFLRVQPRGPDPEVPRGEVDAVPGVASVARRAVGTVG